MSRVQRIVEKFLKGIRVAGLSGVLAGLGFSAAQAENIWVTGDFHQHTVHTDGSYQMSDVFAKADQYGLDWWANSEHGGNFNGNYRWKDVGGYVPTVNG